MITYNYYPVTTRASIRDTTSGLQLSLLPDRSVGASSLKDGQLEFMIHRRLLDNLGNINLNDHDVDGKGVVARGKVFLLLSTHSEVADQTRQLSRDIFMQPILGFSPIDDVSAYQAHHKVQFSALKKALPDNVHLLTLENRGNVHKNEILIRLENFYQPDDESKLTVESKLLIKNIFEGLTVEKVEKTNLVIGQKVVTASNEIDLRPQEIGTFVLGVKRTVTNGK